MKFDLLSMFTPDTPPEVITDFLDQSSFDELFELDLLHDHIRAIYHIEDKYRIPMTQSSYHGFYGYVSGAHVHPDDRTLYRETMEPTRLLERVLHGKLPELSEIKFRVMDAYGKYRWVQQILVAGSRLGLADGTVRSYIYDIQNIKDRMDGRSLIHEGLHVTIDALTGLMKERSFVAAAEDMLAKPTEAWVLVAIDLEKLKLFNEWYGWDKGNMVLADVGSCLDAEAKDSGGLACYRGNDDFCLLAPERTLDIEGLFARIRMITGRHGMSVGFLPAFGIRRVSDPVPYTPVVTLLDNATLACQHAKGDFKNRIVDFSSEMLTKTEGEYNLLSDFQRAIAQNEICFYLQPQCRASTGQIVGAEALARWQKKDGHFVSPATFVPVLEKTGFVTDLDTSIWESVAAWIRSMLDADMPMVPVSVNVSQIDLFTIDVPSFFEDLIARHDIPVTSLKVEITESASAGDSQKIREDIRRLRRMGFVVMMDDFGSGYSSLNMLHDMDMDVIKVDAMFLRYRRRTENRAIHILETVISMAKTLGTPIIVEGVESKEQVDFLASTGCRYMQGYYFYKPMSPHEFGHVIAEPGNIDPDGFVAKDNAQFRLREFLDETIYSDTMLNSILGPVAFYEWNGDNVDIVRYNEQFYEAVNVTDFHERLNGIQRVMPASDVELMKDTLAMAVEDRLNGASAVLNFYRNDKSFSRFLIRFYYLGDRGQSKLFYGAAHDVTQITKLQKNMEIISKFFSGCIMLINYRDGVFTYDVAAQGIEELGLTREELLHELQTGEFYRRVAPEYQDLLHSQCMDAIEGIDFSAYCTLTAKNGQRLPLFIKSDYVEDDAGYVRCILLITKRQVEQ